MKRVVACFPALYSYVVGTGTDRSRDPKIPTLTTIIIIIQDVARAIQNIALGIRAARRIDCQGARIAHLNDEEILIPF